MSGVTLLIILGGGFAAVLAAALFFARRSGRLAAQVDQKTKECRTHDALQDIAALPEPGRAELDAWLRDRPHR